MYYKQKIGKEGENIAVEYLKKIGYNILERNFQCRQGEIDIIALDKREYVFIEVKTRTNNNYGKPIDAVDKNKIKHLKKSIIYYIYINKLENEFIRIDVIEIIKKNEKFYINHIKQII